MNKMTLILVLAGGLLAAFFVTGCSLAEKVSESEEAQRAVVQNRVLSYIDGDAARASAVIEQAQTIRSGIKADRITRAKHLEEALTDSIPWERMSDAETHSVKALLRHIQSGIDRYADQDERLSREQRLYLVDVLDWVIEAAEIVP